MNLLFGTVTGGDANTGVIVINSPAGGEQTIRVNADTQFMAQKLVDVSALQVGDRVQVQGVPTAITASSISVGQVSDLLQFGGAQGGNRRGNNGGNQGVLLMRGDEGPGGRMAQQAFASASGKVTSTSPLTISISDTASITLKLATDAKITKIQKATINNLKNGDTILVFGQAGNDGAFTATSVGINISMTGPGGLFGGGGFGGPGGQMGFPNFPGRRNPRNP